MQQEACAVEHSARLPDVVRILSRRHCKPARFFTRRRSKKQQERNQVMQDVLNMPTYLGTPTLTWARRRFRNAALAMARFRSDIGRWVAIATTVRALHALDNRMLADIGLVRSGFQGAARYDLRMNSRANPSARSHSRLSAARSIPRSGITHLRPSWKSNRGTSAQQTNAGAQDARRTH